MAQRNSVARLCRPELPAYARSGVPGAPTEWRLAARYRVLGGAELAAQQWFSGRSRFPFKTPAKAPPIPVLPATPCNRMAARRTEHGN
jgi:hypothetical protein